MDFEKMIQSENTDCLYDDWESYRNELTNYIISSIEDYYRKKKLTELKERHFYIKYNMKDICKELGYSPTLAIWGAGGCNDIDIAKLSKYFNLVLIDHNVEMIENAKKRFGLSDEKCICTDLKFWDISKEDYLMFDALLKDNVSKSDIEMYIKDLVINMPDIDYKHIPHFDFSVMVGLASQLNSRFAALIHLNKYPYDLTNFFGKLNELAVNRLIKAVYEMTNNMFIAGFETRLIETGTYKDKNGYIELLNEKREIDSSLDNYQQFSYMETEIAGNDYLIEGLRRLVSGEYITFLSEKYLWWNFLVEKNYIMDIKSYEK